MNGIDYGGIEMNNTSEKITVLATAYLPADAVRAIRHNDGTLCRIEHLPTIHDLIAAGEIRISEQPDVTGLYAVQAVRVDTSAVLTVRKVQDDDPDTSYLGRYTDNADDWCIVRATGVYVAKVHQRNRIIEEIKERIQDETELSGNRYRAGYTERQRARLARIEASGETELPRSSREYRFFKPADNGEAELPRSSREYRFFKPADNGEAEGTADYKKHGLQNWKRYEALNNGGWHYIGITATVTLTRADGFERKVSSGGLWGIESDSGEYLKEVAHEQIEEIRAEVEKYAPMPEWDGEFDGNN